MPPSKINGRPRIHIFLENPGKILENFGKSWKILDFFGKSWKVLENIGKFLELSVNFWKNSGIFWKTVETFRRKA